MTTRTVASAEGDARERETGGGDRAELHEAPLAQRGLLAALTEGSRTTMNATPSRA